MGIWLRLFQILTILGIIILPIVIAYVVYTLWGVEVGKKIWIDMFATLVESLPFFIFSIMIFQKLKIIEPTTPLKIEELLIMQCGISIFTSLVLYILYKQSITTIKPSAILTDLIYCVIWVSFFRRSKRVKSFYKSEEKFKQ